MLYKLPKYPLKSLDGYQILDLGYYTGFFGFGKHFFEFFSNKV